MPNSNVIVEVIDTSLSVDLTEQVVVVELGTSGPQGPMGEVQSTMLGYVHNQAVSSSTWTINHGLSFVPSITVVDSAGSVVEGAYDYPDNNTIIATFSNPFSGKAYLS